MPKSIEQLTDHDRTILRDDYISSAETFWWRIRKDPALVDKLRLPDDAARTRVLRVMASQCVGRADRIATSFLGRHALDIVIVVVIIFLVVAISRKGIVSWRSPHSVAIVFLDEGVPPFHVIQRGEVSAASVTADATVVESPEDVFGRYPLEYLPKGRPIDRSALSNGPRLGRELVGLQLMQISFPADRMAPSVAPPLEISLAAAAASGGALVGKVYLLEIRRQGDTMMATVATSQENIAKLTPFFVAGKLTPVWPIR